MVLRREPVVIIGAGGHAKVIIDIIKTQNSYDIVGCLDEAPGNGREVAGVKIIGADVMLPKLRKNGIDKIFVAIGDNKKRAELAKQAQNLGFRLINAISPYAYIADTVELHDGLAVMPGAVVNAGSRIMDNAIVNTKASVDHDCVVGSCCHVGPGCTLAGNVRLGEGVFLGAGTAVIPGVSVGSWSVTGAGAAIVADIPANALAVGVPGKVIKMLSR